jgi:glutathione S-transferase
MAPITVIGSTGSPYTRKMLSLLRYRRIPYRIIWGEPATELTRLGVAPPRIAFHPTLVMADADGEPTARCDSTPIIHELETIHSERGVVPADPALAFLDYLLEDFADEWCTKYMFHYRWHGAEDAHNAGTLLPVIAEPQLDADIWAERTSTFSARQIGRLGVVGSSPETAATIHASYRRLLELLDAHFAVQPFLLGQRPAAADFALFGQFSQLVGFDPTPRRLAHELAPRTVAWVGLMEDLSGMEPREQDWHGGAEIPASLQAILAELGRGYVPAMLANAAALAAKEKQWSTTIDGAQWTQQSFPYQGKCLHWLRERYAALNDEARQRVDTWLTGTGCDALWAGV